ncbi:MAG: hypothetical protein JXB04_12390 [Kiritimatiellae bacterium]|nr:hypothetical protein [Kiritimatiellia bacterium]
MTNTDFFDDDLIQHRDSVKRIKMGPGDERIPEAPPETPSAAVGGVPVSELNLTRMARHKEEVEGQVARAMQELERLRLRQEDIEKEKHELEELRRKQDEYMRGKKEMMGRLGQSLLLIEKEEVRSSQLLELLVTTRKKFKTMLAELEAFDEETWGEDEVSAELDKALAVIDDTRVDFNKSMAKIQTITGSEPKAAEKGAVYEEAGSAGAVDSFGRWLKVGVAVSLPLIVVLLMLAMLFALFLRSQGLL